MRYLNEEQEQQLNGLLQRYADEQESLTVRSGRTIIYRGTPGSNPEIERITPQQLNNLSNALNQPELSTGNLKITKEQSYQVQNGQQVGNNTLQSLDRSQKPSSQSPEMAELLSMVTELKQHSVEQSNRMAAWSKEMRSMREVIERQEQLLKQANTPVHKKLGNWFDQQKEGVGNWLNQQKGRIDNRIEDFSNNIESFKNNVQSSFSNAKQQVITNVEEFRDGIKERIADAKQQTRDNIDRFTGVADLKEEVRRLREVLKLQEEQQRKLSQEFRPNPNQKEVTQPKAKLSAQPAQAAEVAQVAQAAQATPVPLRNENLDKSREIQNQEIAQLNDRQKADFHRLVSKSEQQKLIEFRSKQLERNQFNGNAPLVPQYLEFRQEQERQREAQELADKQRYSRPPVLQLSLGGGNSQADPWYYLAKAPEDMQIRMGIIPPQEITPAGAVWQSQFVADCKRLKAEEMITAEKERLKSAGFSPKQIDSREKDIRSSAFDQVGEEWKRENAEKLKKWQESQAEKSFQSFVRNQPTLTVNGEASQRSAARERVSGNQSLQVTLVDFQLNPKSYMEGMNQRAFINLTEKFHDQQQREQELSKHLQKFPGDWQSQNELKKLNKDLQTSQRVTSHTEKVLLERGELKPITVSALKQWKQEAEALRLTGNRSPEHVSRIELIERRAELNPQSKTVAVLPIELEKLRSARREFEQSHQKLNQLQSRPQIEPQQQSLSQTPNGAVTAQSTLVNENQATKNGQQPQQVLEQQQQSPKVQNGAAQSTQRVHVSELKQWRQEAEALGIHSENYLNKIDKLTELAEQKAGSDGRVPLKESDLKRMQADRQEFKETKGQAQSQNQTQSPGMRMR